MPELNSLRTLSFPLPLPLPACLWLPSEPMPHSATSSHSRWASAHSTPCSPRLLRVGVGTLCCVVIQHWLCGCLVHALYSLGGCSSPLCSVERDARPFSTAKVHRKGCLRLTLQLGAFRNTESQAPAWTYRTGVLKRSPLIHLTLTLKKPRSASHCYPPSFFQSLITGLCTSYITL